ncbi:hypothetical protein FALCPG4_015713 [Fusarium falciforme]
MAELRESIERLRFANTNSEHRYFIPEAALFEIVTESAVKLSLRSFDVPVHEVRDLTDGIMRGARKCFAILVSIDHGGAISGFFRHDLLQHSHPDHRLPYASEILKQVFEEDEASPTIKRFLEKQWEFAIPILHQNMISRNLDTNVILPFLHEEPAGRGSMGTAWKIEIHPQCHRLPLKRHTVIRK